jgi:hypothetical protein
MYAEQQIRDAIQAQNSANALAQGAIRGGYNPGAIAAAEARQLEVPHQLEMLDRNIKGIAQGIDHLESRLSESILRPVAPQAQANATSPVPVQNSHVGSRMQDANTLLALLNERVQSLIARLEA